jgi:acetyl esterase
MHRFKSYLAIKTFLTLANLFSFTSCYHLSLSGSSPDRVYSYHSQGKELKVLHYQSRRPTHLIILWHGGGWKKGSPENMSQHCDIFIKHNIDCIVPEYSLADGLEATPILALKDVQNFKTQFKDLSETWGVATLTLWSGGSSAGGLLAAWSPGEGLILWSPVLKLNGQGAFDNNVLDSMSRVEMDVLLNQQIQARPTLIFHGDRDVTVPIQGSLEYCELLDDQCSMEILLGEDHRVYSDDRDLLATTLKKSSDFIKNY